MTIAIKYNPNVTWESEFLILQQDDSPSDLRGVTFRMHVRARINSPEIIAIASSSNGKIEIVSITSIYNNQEITGDGIKITLTPEDTLNIYQNAKNAVADIEATFPSGKILPEILNLLFEPNLSVTRDF